MTQNTTGVPLNVTKTPQCRHSEKQEFVSYETQVVAGVVQYRATCSNCGSVGAWFGPGLPTSVDLLKDGARNALMLIEADEL